MMARTARFVCIAVAVSLLAANGAARENKLTWMEKQSEQTPVIKMTESTFGNYLNAGPRPYHTLVTFTARGGGSCQPCSDFHDILVPVAETFHRARHGAEPPKTPLFFAEVDVTDCRVLFEMFKLTSAPYTVLLPSTSSKKTRDIKTFIDRLSAEKVFQPTQKIEAADLFQFLTDRTRIQPVLEKTFPIPAPYLIAGYVVLCIVVLAFGEILWNLRRAIGWVTAVATLAFYLFNVSGGQYNRIRETPWSYGASWIVPQSRNQCQLEGLVIAGAYFGASVMAVLIINAQRAPKEKDEDDDEDTTTPRVLAIVGRLLKQFPTMFSIVGMASLFHVVLWVYTQKSPGYNLGMLQFSG